MENFLALVMLAVLLCPLAAVLFITVRITRLVWKVRPWRRGQ